MRPNYDLLPAHMREGMRAYIETGRIPGSFLQAIICNDLKNAVLHADAINVHALSDYVLFLSNEVPSICQGDEGAMTYWNKVGGMQGVDSSF